ncbi:MAG TPA: MFS transporter [Bryobacteraceae bacterium]|nr:MFS transporter [Bryobacteraceae bacterium]HPT27283.1 MFS transporter [Bryobacteraceae bacterium]
MPTGFRWRIVAILFLSTVINYIDRQTLSVLAPLLKAEYQWNNEQFGVIVIAFRIAYTIGQAVSGRFIDRLGTRQGLTITVVWYSIVAMATSLATGLRSFCTFRFLLGLGESANWPGATKAVSEWFPRKERALAVAIFDSGSSIGAAVAPALVLAIYHYFGGWRPAFLFTGTLGFLWLIVWRRYYHSPEQSPWVRQQEQEMILRDRETPSVPVEQVAKRSWIDLLRYRQTWGAIAARGLTDPVWFFITDWFAIYLTSRGFRLEQSLLAFWIPFLCADLGNYAGGAVSSWLVHRGWPVGRARKAIVVPGGLGVLFLIPAAYSSSLSAISLFFGLATFSYAAFSTIANTLPADLFDTSCVASVSGITGAAAGLGTILSTYAVGYIADRQGFQPVVTAASAVPVIAMVLVLLLVRNTRHSGKGTVQHV